MKIQKCAAYIAIVVSCSCDSNSTNASVGASTEEAATAEVAASNALIDKIKRNKSVLFISSNGMRRGLDNDATLELRSDGSFVLWEYKVGPLDFYGKYTISEDGSVRILFKDSRKEEWPEMKVASEGQRFLLHRINDTERIALDETLRSDSDDGFWPLAEPLQKM